MSSSERDPTTDRPPPRESRLVPDASGRRLYDLLIDSATECAIFALDIEGRVASWNSGAERLVGYSAQEIIGQHFSLFYTDDDRGVSLPRMGLAQPRGPAVSRARGGAYAGTAPASGPTRSSRPSGRATAGCSASRRSRATSPVAARPRRGSWSWRPSGGVARRRNGGMRS